MKNIKIVIVDDSPFSINIIKDILEEKDFQVVGEAGSLEEVKKVVEKTKPDIVTMDMTLPGTDGLECTRAIHKIDENIKVIVISSMMDDEIIKEAKENKVSGYLQKPIDPDELVALIEKIKSGGELFEELKKTYFDTFKEALAGTMNRFTKTIAEFGDSKAASKVEVSRGVSVIIGITGNFTGRMILDLSIETAENMAKTMLRKDPKDVEEGLKAIAEFTNIIAGNACSMLNRKHKAYGLRVAPPIIFYGKCVNIAQVMLETVSVPISTKFGDMGLNVGFKRGEEEWM